MSWDWLILPPVAALIGWVTNWLAVKMIFRPRVERRILGVRVQGLLPKRRREFAHKIAATIEEHLFSAEDVRRALSAPEVKGEILVLVEKKVDHFIHERLIGSNPMLGAFLKGPFVDSMRAKLVEEVGGLFDEGAGLIGDRLDEKLDLKAVVAEKIEGFDMAQLEEIVLAVAKKELRAIEVLGAVLGFLVGLLQLGLLRLM
ncbi:MAG: DUF445 family protein [Planctomycetota bacterium]